MQVSTLKRENSPKYMGASSIPYRFDFGAWKEIHGLAIFWSGADMMNGTLETVGESDQIYNMTGAYFTNAAETELGAFSNDHQPGHQ